MNNWGKKGMEGDAAASAREERNEKSEGEKKKKKKRKKNFVGGRRSTRSYWLQPLLDPRSRKILPSHTAGAERKPYECLYCCIRSILR